MSHLKKKTKKHNCSVFKIQVFLKQFWVPSNVENCVFSTTSL